METAAFVIGLSGLIGVVDKAFSVCQYVNEIREFAQNISEQLFKVENESEKASCWAIEMSQFAALDGAARDANPGNDGGDQNIERTTIRETMEQRVEICLIRLGKALKDAENIIKSQELTKNHTKVGPKQMSLQDAVFTTVPIVSLGVGIPELRVKLREQKRLRTLEGMALRKKVKYTFKPWGTDDRKRLDAVIQDMAYWNGELWSLLSRQMQERCQFQVSCAIMARTNDSATLSAIEAAIPDVPPNLSATAGLGREKLFLERSNTPVNIGLLFHEWKAVHFSAKETRYPLVKLATDTQRSSLLVDWARYGHLQSGQRSIAQQRIAQICTLLSAANNPEAIQLLPSAGYMEDVVRKRYGILLQIPPALQSKETTLVGVFSLIEVLEMNKPGARRELANLKPSLPQRLRLVRKLVYSFIQLHSARWFHKGFRSDKVVFFATKNRHAEGDENPSVDFEKPYVVGFEFARPFGNENVSLPILRDPGNQIYIHPDLLASDALEDGDTAAATGTDAHGVLGPRFIQAYDLYSLALVLIEIGLWQPLSTFVKPDAPAASLRGEFEKLATRNLAHTMGPGYRDAVVNMLRWQTAGAAAEGARGVVDEESRWTDGLDRAYWEVVRPLEECACGLSS